MSNKPMPYPPGRAFPSTTADALRDLQTKIGEANAAKGFHDEHTQLLVAISAAEGVLQNTTGEVARSIFQSRLDTAHANHRNFHMMRVSLWVTEAAEGLEELRKGHPVNETYFPTSPDGVTAHHDGELFKPEGFLSEAADVLIRVLDEGYLCTKDAAHGDHDFDLVEMIEFKLAFNATRQHMHGKKV